MLITFFLFCSHAHALVFERRPRTDPELSYFLYPVAGSIPGLQDFTAWEHPFPDMVEAKWILRPSVCAEKQNILRKEISALNFSRYSISPFSHHA